MPRVTLFEWGGARHGEIAKRGQKIKSSATARDIKDTLVPYFSSKAVFQVDATQDIVLSSVKPPPGEFVTIDEFHDPTATLEQVCSNKKIKKLYFSLTPDCVDKNTTDNTSTTLAEEEEEEEDEEEEERQGETKANGPTASPPSLPVTLTPHPLAPETKHRTPVTSPPPQAPSTTATSTNSGGAKEDQPVPEDYLLRQQYEKNKYDWIRSYIYEESPQHQYRHTVQTVSIDPDLVLFDRTGWNFAKHPNERRFGWLFGNRHSSTNTVKVHAMYEPPQKGLTQHVLLRPDIYFPTIISMAKTLGMDVVGCIRTRPFRTGPYGKGTEDYPTANEAMFMASMQAKFDDGRSQERYDKPETSSSKSNHNTTTTKEENAVPNTRGNSFVSLVYAVQFSSSDQTAWNGGLQAFQVSSQMTELYRNNQLSVIKGEEYEIGTKKKVFAQVRDPRFPDAAWEWKKQQKFSTMSVHIPIGIVQHKSWLSVTKMPWSIENRDLDDVPTKYSFKARLQQFSSESMLNFFGDFHFLIWLLLHHNEIGLKEEDVKEIVHAVRDGDRDLCDSYRAKLEALAGIGFRDPYVMQTYRNGAGSQAAPEKANILAEQVTLKYSGSHTAVLCPIRSALSQNSEERSRKYNNLARDYGLASKKAIQKFKQQHNISSNEDACIAIVGGVTYGGPEMALALWHSLKHGTQAAQELARARTIEVEEAKTSAPEVGFGFGGGRKNGGNGSGDDDDDEEYRYESEEEDSSDSGGDDGGGGGSGNNGSGGGGGSGGSGGSGGCRRGRRGRRVGRGRVIFFLFFSLSVSLLA